MIPDETSPAPVDERLLARMLACDALLHASSTAPEHVPAGSASSFVADDRARSRLLLLLRLLESAEPSWGRPKKPGADPGRDDRDENRPLLGRFEVRDDLGSGGFGFVVRARDLVLGREVALKMPLPERVLAANDVDRFLREARAAARLDHPNIVRVFDAGELGPLGYFIASEFCDGPTLRHWLKSQNEPVPARLAAHWLAALAAAVQHAHDRGILHRDIKPDNVILAGGPGSDGLIPRLTDFGLAKLVEEAGEETRSEARLGTPHYMAPEQAAGRRREVGPATDVYALGATLYELVTGRPPFRGETDAETLRLALETQPVAPRSLRPGLPRDLETIALKCLRKEPARRYASAGALHDDLQRFLDGRPILGRPISAWEHARGWTRRRPTVVALLGLVVLLVCGLVGGIVAWASWLGSHNHRLEIQVARADRQTREAERQTGIAENRQRLSDRHSYAASLRRARQALGARQIELAQDILHDVQPGPDGFDPRGFAWRYLWRQANLEFSQLWGHRGRLLEGVVAPDGRSVATVDLSGNILIWELTDGVGHDRPIAGVSTRFPEWTTMRFSSDGRFLALGQVEVAGPAQGFHVFDRLAGRPPVQVELHAGEGISSLAFDDRRKLLVFIIRGPDGFSLRFFELANLSAKPQTRFLGPSSCKPFLSADGRVVCVVNRGGIELSEPETGRVLVHLADAPAEPCWVAKFSPDGRFVSGASGKRILVWETVGGRRIGHATGDPLLVVLDWSARGRFLAWGAEDGRLAILEPASGRVRELLSGSSTQKLRSRALSFSSDEMLLAVSTDRVQGGPKPAEVWDLDRGRRIWEFPGRNEGGSVCFVPGGHDLLVTANSGPRVCRLEPETEPDALGGHSAEAWAAAFAPDGQVLATGSDDTHESQTIRLWDPATGRLLAGWKGHTATVASLAFSPDGRVLASGSLDSGKPGHPNLLLWDVDSHRELARLPGHTDQVRSVAFSPDGQWLATASDDMTARLWDVAGRRPRAILTGHTKKLTSIAFSPDGRLLASGSNDATVRLWDVDTGQAATIVRDVANVLAVAFAPDGSLLASGNENGEIKLWNPATGNLVRTIPVDADQLRCLAFTPDGRNVIAAGKGKVIRVWEVATDQELLSLEGHQAQINALTFSLDGLILASCSHDGAVRLWRAEPIQPVPAQ
jgi:WD40 repeat protein